MPYSASGEYIWYVSNERIPYVLIEASLSDLSMGYVEQAIFDNQEIVLDETGHKFGVWKTGSNVEVTVLFSVRESHNCCIEFAVLIFFPRPDGLFFSSQDSICETLGAGDALIAHIDHLLCSNLAKARTYKLQCSMLVG